MEREKSVMYLTKIVLARVSVFMYRWHRFLYVANAMNHKARGTNGNRQDNSREGSTNGYD